MLISAIREKVSGWIVWVIVGLICVTFALWGIQEYLDGLNRVVVAKVNGEEIDYDSYQRTLNNRRQYMVQTFGNRIDQSLFSSDEFKTETVESMIADRLIAADVRDSGYRISDEQLASLIQNFPSFKDSDGNFSKELYTVSLARQGLTPQGFEQMQRQQNAIDQIRNGFVTSAFITEKELNRMIALSDETRASDVALVPYSKFEESVEVTDEEARAEYDENQESYRAPARAKFEFVELSVASLTADISVSDDDAMALYEQNKQQYLDEEQREVRHILVKLDEDADADTDKAALDKANELLEKIKAGEDFAELAKEHSDDAGSAANGGELGLVGRGVMVKPFEDAMFAMEKGAVSDAPVRSRFGYHILKLEEIESEQIKPFEDVKDEILAEERRNRAVDRFGELAENFRNVVFEQPDTLEPAASEIEVSVASTDWIDRTGGPAMWSNPRLLDAAFSDEVLQEDLNSAVIELDNDTLVAVRKVDYEESRIKAFDDASEDATEAVRQKKLAESAKAFGDALIKKLEDGGTWEDVLAEVEIVPVEGPSKRVDPKATPVSRALVESVFSAEAPEAAAASYGGSHVLGTNYAVFRLTDVSAGSPEKLEDAAREQLTQRLRRRLGDEVYLGYQEDLRLRADVSLLEENLQNDS